MTLPEGWKKVPLSNLAIINKETLAEGTSTDYRFRYIDLSSVKEGRIEVTNHEYTYETAPVRARRKFHKGNILMSTVRPNLKGFAYVDFDGSNYICSTGFAVLQARSDISSGYLYQYLYSKSIEDQIERILVGSNYPAINSSDVNTLRILIPCCNGEQQKIAEILCGVDAAIEATRKLIDQTAKFKKTMMNSLLTCGLTGKHTHFQPTALGNIPAEWKFTPLGSLFNLVERPIKMADDKEYQLVTVKRRNGGVVPRERLLGKQIKVKSQFEVREGDFLISKRQIVHGACEIVPENLSGAIISNEYNVLQAKEGLYLPYFRWVTRSQFMYRYFMVSSVGVHIEKMLFKLDHWYKQKIPLPSLEEQKKITEVLESIERSAADNQDRLDHLKALKTALMQVLLTGKVRVPLDTGSQKKFKNKRAA